ncbi:MAG TPA: 50S ribosomal protein L5 [Candidatus Sulfotelmatobacter sp.]|jgi:large subunit ribosomal protein L5|nr:50S ribosomal protein L5 [Candidatus Sulfotelmatobacter sp.]
MDLQKKYKEEIVQKLEKDLGIKNPMAVPHLEKIVINMGVKDAASDKKVIEKMSGALGQITGQKAKPTRARKAIAGFKIREGDVIGLMITLRGKRMYQFYDRLIKIVLPRLRDFRGVPRGSFDGRGNYTLGFHEYSTFPEIDPASVERLQGMEMVFVTSAPDNAQGFALLEALGMPFAKEAKNK